MNNKNHFFLAGKVGLLLGGVLLVALTGCVGYADGPRAAVYVPPPAVIVEDEYIYYPDYEVYYSSRRHQYAYRDGRAWVSRPAPRGVSVDVLFASPSVRMDFHDSPERHHAEVVRQYPGHRAQPGSNQGRNSNRQDNQRDQRDQRGGDRDR